MRLQTMLTLVGNLAHRSQLAQLGIGRRTIDQALRERILVPVAPGWVATSAALRVAVVAVLNGARLTGATALRTYGVWAGTDRRLHLQRPPKSHTTKHPPMTPLARFAVLKHFVPHGTRMHWAPYIATPPVAAAWRVSILDALMRFCRSESEENVVAAISSAVHEKLLSRRAAMTLFDRLPARLHHLATRCTFADGSGLETIARLRLERLGLSLVQQVQIGPDRVDFVIAGWLVLEFDGDEWHDPKLDRERTNRLVRAGYYVLRFGYDHVMYGWTATLATIQTALRDQILYA
jgi:very-short-patch-repair endonuclease